MSKCASMEFVWNMEDLFHSMLESLHIPYRFFPSIPYSIPYHSMPCLQKTVAYVKIFGPL